MTATSPGHDVLAVLDPAVRHDPYPLYARLRELAPVRLDPAPVVVLASYADCAALLRHPLASVNLGRRPRAERDHARGLQLQRPRPGRGRRPPPGKSFEI